MKETLKDQGFTLLELIGVMAIMAILAAIIAPNLIKLLQVEQQEKEEKVLKRLASGLENYICKNRIIPLSAYGTSTWSSNIASQVNLPPKKVHTNDLNCDRRYWFDPSTDLNGLSDGSAAYDQNTVSAANISGDATSSTASAPTNPRAMIISDITGSCSNNINSPADNDANFVAVWDQTGVLTEGNKLKIIRINLSHIFETVTLQSVDVTQFARKTYSAPPSAAPTVDFPLFTVEKNSHIFAVSYETGGFSPTDISGGAAAVDIGYSSGGGEFLSAINMTLGTASTPLAVTYTSTSAINTSLELTISGASVTNGDSGYIDVSLHYQGEPQYKLEGRTGNPTTISISSPGTTEIKSFNVINGTTLYLYDQSWTGGSPTGDLLLSVVIKDSENFIYSPGPPTFWGRYLHYY